MSDSDKTGNKTGNKASEKASDKTIDKTDNPAESYKDTLNLPNTAFPMKGNLPSLEPRILQKWEEMKLYQTLLAKQKGKPKFVLPDGPPYANGDIHMGHAVNHILKDIVLKSKALLGFQTAFIPGWDCHGLPVELNVEKQIGKPGDKVDAKTFRQKCREYVLKQIDAQRKSFIRLGMLGDWEHRYATMDFGYEADTIRSLAKIVENGHLHKGYRPVHWCIDCGSALAEAEVEYRDKTSPSIDVCFEVADVDALSFKIGQSLMFESISVVIWTTTPWTLPANEAVAVHPEYSYALVQFEKKRVIIAADLVSMVMKRWGLESYQVLLEFPGEKLEGLKLRHPFYDKEVPVVLGEHVTLDAGTGAVHTAPAHGQDDFVVGQKYHLPLENPVGSNGCYVAGTPLLEGLHVLKANDKIIALLKEKGHLLHEEKIQHSYPHCWRHKTALIFRATSQWFIGMEQKKLRENALKAIQKVEWIPSWGQSRIEGMVRDRPDWCISRQRTWGVPLCFFLHKGTGDLHPKTPELMRAVADKVEKAGVDAWYDFDPKEVSSLLGKEADQYEKSTDILDVWFDSGISHEAVMRKRPELQFPADLYLEGSDQHRGWFQSSLLSSVAMNNVAPYKQVLTHGFVVDAEGHKMSKSLGNVIAPDKVMNTMGADVLRLWVSATDYRGEIVFSEELLKRIADSYRRIRNTARFLLANLNEFDPKKNLLPPKQMLALDRYILFKAKELQEKVAKAYSEYQFHVVYQEIHNFCSVDLGSFYLDIIKDRQYTGKRDGIPRRSAQTAMYHMMESLVRLMAPILSFTAEEIWQYMPGDAEKREASVFLVNKYYEFPEFELEKEMNEEFWERVREIRDAVNKELEGKRAENLIGSGLEAELVLYANPEIYQLLSPIKEELRFVFITSKAELKKNEETKEAFYLKINRSPYEKCVRCWHRREDVNKKLDYPGLCGRCVENVGGKGETRSYA